MEFDSLFKPAHCGALSAASLPHAHPSHSAFPYTCDTSAVVVDDAVASFLDTLCWMNPASEGAAAPRAPLPSSHFSHHQHHHVTQPVLPASSSTFAPAPTFPITHPHPSTHTTEPLSDIDYALLATMGLLPPALASTTTTSTSANDRETSPESDFAQQVPSPYSSETSIEELMMLEDEDEEKCDMGEETEEDCGEYHGDEHDDQHEHREQGPQQEDKYLADEEREDEAANGSSSSSSSSSLSKTRTRRTPKAKKAPSSSPAAARKSPKNAATATSPAKRGSGGAVESSAKAQAKASKAAAAAAAALAAKRKWSRSHTRKEPTRDEFESEEEFTSAWTRWRELRDNNNDAVKRSRENKKRLLPVQCRQPRCLHMSACMSGMERKVALLLKAIRTPQALTHAEQREYTALVASSHDDDDM